MVFTQELKEEWCEPIPRKKQQKNSTINVNEEISVTEEPLVSIQDVIRIVEDEVGSDTILGVGEHDKNQGGWFGF